MVSILAYGMYRYNNYKHAGVGREFSPQFVLAVAVAFTDGLVARHVRRVQGGHESATRYHHAKHLLMFGVIPLGAIIWLVARCRYRSSSISGRSR
nr:DUF4400 domain-containing protein [Trinickia symbiotica]